MASQKNKEASVILKQCVCGRSAIIVKSRLGKLVSCPNPTNCKGNLRTPWRKSEEQAITDWNILVDCFTHTNT